MKIVSDISGQGTVEAAFTIPIVFLLMLLLLQPGIVFYDYIVMQNAAAEGSRLAATTAASELSTSCTEYVRHRLSAVPQQELFHVHDSVCTWEIEIIGGETAEYSEVRITNQLRPLPLFDVAFNLLGASNDSGNIEIHVKHTQRNQPEWVASSATGSPADWVEMWP